MAPERIIVGGGLSALPDLLTIARAEVIDQLRGYPDLCEHRDAAFLVPAALGAMAGPTGSLILAERAAASQVSR